MWEWLCYDDGGDEDLWDRWYHEVDDAVRGKHDTIIDFLECRGAHEWRINQHTEKINDDLIEIRIHGSVQHRLLGFFGPARGQFTFVISCTHKKNVYSPKSAKKTAAARKKSIEKGTANVRACQRPKDVDEAE
jgi:hypothetical protein